MNKEELLKAIMKLPKEKPNIPITTMNSINVDDLISAVDRLNEVPNYNDLLKENKQLKEKLSVAETNEETFRLEMEDITQTLGLDEDTIFDDVKAYVRSLRDNWNKLKEWLKEYEEGTYGLGSYETGLSDGLGDVIKKMQELEGSDSDE